MKCHKMLCVHCAYIVWILAQKDPGDPLSAAESQTSWDKVCQISLYSSKNVSIQRILYKPSCNKWLF